VFLLVAGHQAATRRDHAPPRQPFAFREDAADGSGRSGVTGLLGNFAVGRYVSGSKRRNHRADAMLEFAHVARRSMLAVPSAGRPRPDHGPAGPNCRERCRFVLTRYPRPFLLLGNTDMPPFCRTFLRGAGQGCRFSCRRAARR